METPVQVCAYQMTTLEGCVLNVREWLQYRTWIQWHIRDEKGHPRTMSELVSTNSYEPKGE